VGEKTSEQLAAAGLRTVGDMINFLPRTYDDFSRVEKIANLRPGKVTIKARAESVATRFVRRGMRVTTAVLSDDSGKVQAVWFNQPYRETQLKSGAEFYFSGEFGLSRNRYQLSNPSCEIAKDLPVQTGRLLPVYPRRKGLKPALARKILNELKPLIAMMAETLPHEIVVREKLLNRADALMSLHFPTSSEQAKQAEQRLAFEELFGLILAARMNKKENSRLGGFAIKFDQPRIAKFVANLPFALTAAQKRALWEILQNFERATPMNRLLQGDVGSGKTVVAGAAAYQASLAGYQTALMAPTEILATQHAETLAKLFRPCGISVALLTGAVKGKNRVELLKQIANGEAQIVVGTHALFQAGVEFANLGFAIIDEQHRFGVKQRQELLAKSRENCLPHLLAMTATPIPRSLQLTLFGDLDISILNELPRGRKPIKTEIISPVSRTKMNEKIREELASGRQIYFIAPNIENTEKSEKENVANLFKKVSREFKNFAIGVLHGKMKSEEKDKIMRDFANGEMQILVATTVVEVGVDVPNATVIVVENADQFGLAQLHQLRGRVGRGEHQSFCFLVQSDSSAPPRRLREIANSNDGFHLAEVDLELRGAGEIYGTMQHGAMNLQIANLADTKLIKRAAVAADWFIASGQNLLQYKELSQVVAKYQRLTTLN
jgi:ATP-dependent DNA helicase RecG